MIYTMAKIQNKTGASVERENFYGREQELYNAFVKINDGNSLILAAPRRVGKTSFAKKMAEICREKGWAAIYLDLESIRTEEQFVRLFVDKLMETEGIFPKIKEWVTTFLENTNIKYKDLEVKHDKSESDLFKKLHDLLKVIKDQELLIICDELTIFLNYIIREKDGKTNTEHADYFLNMLRGLRQMSECNHRWIFCSSISIENFLKRNNLSKSMNDVTQYRLDELKHCEAIGLLNALAESYGYTYGEGIAEYILHRIGMALPYYIQLMFAEIMDIKCEIKEPIQTEDIEKAYEQLLGKQCFNTWTERLDDYPEKAILWKILNNISHGPDGCSRDILESQFSSYDNPSQTVASALSILKNDGYIILNDKGKYVFRSFLLRDFWYKEYIA